MSRLTIKDEQGWGVKGMPWSSLYPGSTITLDIWDKLYDIIRKLMEYEDAGLDPDQVSEMDKLYLEKCREVNELKEKAKSENDGWIPVEIRLPDPDEYVLVSFENSSIPMIGWYTVDDDDSGTFRIGGKEESFVQHDLFVNAWMPLPESYKPARLVDADNQTT